VQAPAEDEPAGVSVVLDVTAEGRDGEERVATVGLRGRGFFETARRTSSCVGVRAALAGASLSRMVA